MKNNGFKKGHIVTVEMREKMSKSHKGLIVSTETRKKISKKLKKAIREGRFFTKEHRSRISEAKKGSKNQNYGKHPSKETLLKRSKALKGKRAWNKGLPAWNKGRKSELSGKKSPHWKGGKPKCKVCGKEVSYCCEMCRSCSHKGEKSYLWKGGITPINAVIRNSLEYRLWRNAVFARDNWTCQKVGIRGGKLHPHHIQNFAQYPELRFAIDNGITLSKRAHMEFHGKYGRENNTKEQLKEFLNERH